MLRSGNRGRTTFAWGNCVRTCCEKLLSCFKPISFIILNSILASYLAISYHAAWNKAALRTVHYEMMLLTEQIDKRLEGVENSFSQIIILMTKLHDQIAAGAMSEIAANKTRQEIRKAIQIYDADKTGMTDYALSTLGGCIRTTRKTETYKDGAPPFSLLGIPLMSLGTNPKTIIQPRSHPGECWAFKGHSGRVVIELVTEIYVRNITIEHIPASLSPTGEISSAPKKFLLLGLCAVDDARPHFFGNFTYCKMGPPVQTFRIKNASSKTFKLVEIIFESNHGNPEFTCVYRVRIHGKLPGPP